MDVVEALTWRGGVVDTATLRYLTSRRKIRTALSRREVVRIGRGSYGLPDADRSMAAAARLSGVASHLSAAQLHGWEIKTRPALPTVTVPRGRKVEQWRRAGVDLRWRALDEDEIWNGRTRAGRTVTDCSRDLPFDESLTVADSALRRGNVSQPFLVQLAEEVPRSGRVAALRVAEHASSKAANPFESVLRAISLDMPGLLFEPQVVIDEDGIRVRPDLVDESRRIVLEADSFEFHGRRSALTRDCERYNALALRGWLVLRFSWEHVMHEPAYVRSCLEQAALWRPRRRTQTPVTARKSA
jgi:very-short-patch-repair endonuclease